MVTEQVGETDELADQTTEVEAPELAAPPEPEDDISEEAVAAFLKEEKFISSEPGTAKGDGVTPGVESDEPDFSKLTPQQAYDLGKVREKSELINQAQVESVAQERARRVEGAKAALTNSRNKLYTDLINAGNSAETAMAALQQLDQVHGSWNLVVEHELPEAEKRAKAEFQQFTYDTVAKELGATGKELIGQFQKLPEAEKSTANFYKMFADQVRKDTLKSSDADQEFVSRWKTWFKGLPKEKRDILGLNPAITPSAEKASGVGSRRGTVEWATDAPVAELLADKARRAAQGV